MRASDADLRDGRRSPQFRTMRSSAMRALWLDQVWRARWIAANRRVCLTLEEILDRHVVPEPTSGCWLWISASSGGYPKFSGRWAHRYIYKAFGGRISRDARLEHLCHVRSCVNPRHLTPVMPPAMRSLEEILDSYVHPEPMSGCWVWVGTRDRKSGYGRLGDHWAHRYIYRARRGWIPPGFHLDHLCRNRACCNPDHLQPVTPAVNYWRGVAVRRRRDDEDLSVTPAAAASPGPDLDDAEIPTWSCACGAVNEASRVCGSAPDLVTA
jgi:HNH endonuclease